MHASLSISSRARGPVHAERTGASGALEHDVTRARMALEERYLALLTARDAGAVDELQRVRIRLHQLAEIDGDKPSATREASLRAWLRAA
jgi:hypothetical protein